MKARAATRSGTSDDRKNSGAIIELMQSIFAAPGTYSNVHQGSGHNSLVTTYLYEWAREIILEYLGMDKEKYTVIFCSPRSAEMLKQLMKTKSYRCLSSRDLGIPLGLRALAVEKKALPGGIPFQTSGGTARLVGPTRARALLYFRFIY